MSTSQIIELVTLLVGGGGVVGLVVKFFITFLGQQREAYEKLVDRALTETIKLQQAQLLASAMHTASLEAIKVCLIGHSQDAYERDKALRERFDNNWEQLWRTLGHDRDSKSLG